jgi:hypothetical protein
VEPVCEAVNILLAIVSPADLAEELVFAATVYFTVPFPAPLAPDVIVSQDTPDEAIHEQPLCVVTVTEPEPALELKDWLVGEIVNVQDCVGAVYEISLE